MRLIIDLDGQPIAKKESVPMPGAGAPSEFGGKVRLNRTQPPPHEPTASEKLMLGYTTGDETGDKRPDKGEAFSGILPLDEAEVPEPTPYGYEGPA